jgi:hypothetical protein
MVDERGARLRQLSYEALKALAAAPVEHVMVRSRPATIGIIVLPAADGAIRIVVQGFMKGRLLPGSNVALDGFYKHPDGSVSAMPDEEFNEFD